MERSEAAADESLADMRARIRLGIAIAAMIRMIATTISNSISEKPLCFCICLGLLTSLYSVSFNTPDARDIRFVRMYGAKSEVYDEEAGALRALFPVATDRKFTLCTES